MGVVNYDEKDNNSYFVFDDIVNNSKDYQQHFIKNKIKLVHYLYEVKVL